MKILYEKRAQALYPKDKEFTELDRKVMLNSSIAQLERDYEFLCDLQIITAERVNLGCTYLAATIT